MSGRPPGTASAAASFKGDDIHETRAPSIDECSLLCRGAIRLSPDLARLEEARDAPLRLFTHLSFRSGALPASPLARFHGSGPQAPREPATLRAASSPRAGFRRLLHRASAPRPEPRSVCAARPPPIPKEGTVSQASLVDFCNQHSLRARPRDRLHPRPTIRWGFPARAGLEEASGWGLAPSATSNDVSG